MARRGCRGGTRVQRTMPEDDRGIEFAENVEDAPREAECLNRKGRDCNMQYIS